MPTTSFDWDELEDNIDAEYDEYGNLIAEYTHESGLHGRLISEHRNGQARFHHFDAQGNTLAVTDGDGNVTDTFAYTANGEVTERTGTTETPFQFGGEHGYYTDQTTEEIMVRRRDYDPPRGRWLSVDSLLADSKPDSLDAINAEHPYGYARNNPVLYSDPSGLKVSLRCRPVTRRGVELGRHCNVVVECNGAQCIYEGGGEGTVGTDPAHPDRPVPEERCGTPMKKRSDEHEYAVCTRFTSCQDEVACLANAYQKILQLPYRRLGPNSNTYAHNLLCVCSMEFVPFTVPPPPDPRIGVPVLPPKTISEPPAVGWSSSGYDCTVDGGPTPDRKKCC